jgi:Glyoxalase/Bleomycin resistance protein/Dioxygenase superfamily
MGSLSPIHHVGYVVDDIDHGVEWMVSRFGAGPFFLIPHLQFDRCTYMGEPAHYDHSSAFGQWGNIKVELTVVHASDPPELATRIGGGAPRVGHVGLVVDDLMAESARLEAAGMPLFHAGSSGPVSACWHDATRQMGHHVEVLGRSPQLEGFYELIRSSADGWDGSDPLRPGPGGH